MNANNLMEEMELPKSLKVTGIALSDGVYYVHGAIPRNLDGPEEPFAIVCREQLLRLLDDYIACKAQVVQYRYETEKMSEEIKGLRALLAPKPNLPLTFEQLKDRVGKPVYQVDTVKNTRGWRLLAGVKIASLDHLVVSKIGMMVLLVNDPSKDWRTYLEPDGASIFYYDRETEE